MPTWHATTLSPWRQRLERLRGVKRHTLRFRRAEASPCPGDGQTWVGVAEVDITPPPGIPKGGHSSLSTTGTGVRTRLKARAFYLKDSHGSAALILQVDLHAGSALLREYVAQHLAGVTDIPQHAVCVTCTHTHSGPGQLLESDFYNDFASNASGFDPALFMFISDRLAQAGKQAWDTRRPGRILSGRIDVFGAARNRSWVPYRANTTVSRRHDDDAARQRAVNPWLYQLRLDARDTDGHYKPLGVLSSYSIHGTALPRHERLYNADLWAWFERHAGRRLRDDYDTPWPVVHGACQGTHADNNPDVRRGQRGFPEAKRIGTLLAEAAIGLCHSLDTHPPAAAPTIAAGLHHIDCLREPDIDGFHLAGAAVSTAQVAGATDNSTPLLYHLPFFAPGRASARQRPQAAHGHKRRLGGPLQRLLVDPGQFPHQLLFQVLRIGEFWLLAAPFEITTEAGRRLRESFRAVTGAGELVCVTSLANGYTGYCTTPEEYAHQHYEGGSTLYGPDTQPWIGAHLNRIGSALVSRQAVFEGPQEWQVSLKVGQHFPRAGDPVKREARGAVKHRRHRGEDGWCFRWIDQDPASQGFDRPLVSIEVLSPRGEWQPLVLDGVPIDDDCGDIAIELIRREKPAGWLYEARWHGEIRHARCRFRIEPRGRATVFYSPAFGG